MPDKLLTVLSEYDNAQAKRVKEYSGLLGLTSSSTSPEVPDRNGYVYVRFRDNQSEIVQAYNETVSPVTNLPVIVIRRNANWYVKGRDVDRYSDWGSYSPFLPAHAHQHEFDPDNPGGDITFIYADQFMPLNVFPSGTPGGANVLISGIPFKKSDNSWVFAGGTGTSSLLLYVPSNNQARMALIYLDRTTGNPGILVNSGTSFAANITGTADILPYLPPHTALQEPLKAVRLVSGTTYIGWENLYDVRQFFRADITGSGGGGISEAPIDGLVYGRKNAGWVEVSGTAGGAGTPAGNNQEAQYNQLGSFGASYKYIYDYANNVLIVTSSGTPPAVGSNEFHLLAQNASPGFLLWAASNNSAVNGYIKANRYRGTFQVPQAIEQFDEIFQLRGAAYDGTALSPTQVELLFDAPYNWSSSSHPTRASIWITPSGSTVMQNAIEFLEYGANLQSGKTYNIGGSPHQHKAKNVFGGHGQGSGVPAGSTRYIVPFINGIQSTAYSVPFPGGTLKNLFVRQAGAQPGDAAMVVEIYSGTPGSFTATGIKVTFAAGSAAQDRTDSVNTYAHVDGEHIQIQLINSSSSASANVGGVVFQLELDTTS